MNKSYPPAIASVTTAEYDANLLEDIVSIERLVQPSDSWDKQALVELLDQDINQCWAVIVDEEAQSVELISNNDSSELIESSNSISEAENIRAVAYCIFSTVFEVAEVLRIGTHPDFQRRGYAQWLLEMLIKHMPNKELEKILLEVRQDNIGAIKLYEKMGFEVIHTRKDYYSTINEAGATEYCDALIMEYALTNT